MARLLNKTDISDLCLGTTVLGTGGGGSPELGFLILSRLLEMGKEIRLISAKEVPDDEIVVHPAMIGSIAPSKIDKNLLLCGLSMREGDLYVKRILPQHMRAKRRRSRDKGSVAPRVDLIGCIMKLISVMERARREF